MKPNIKSPKLQPPNWPIIHVFAQLNTFLSCFKSVWLNFQEPNCDVPWFISALRLAINHFESETAETRYYAHGEDTKQTLRPRATLQWSAESVWGQLSPKIEMLACASRYIINRPAQALKSRAENFADQISRAEREKALIQTGILVLL